MNNCDCREPLGGAPGGPLPGGALERPRRCSALEPERHGIAIRACLQRSGRPEAVAAWEAGPFRSSRSAARESSALGLPAHLGTTGGCCSIGSRTISQQERCDALNQQRSVEEQGDNYMLKQKAREKG